MNPVAEYTFTSDWFSHMIPLWEQTLLPLAGTDELNYLEIGCYEGRATCWALEHVLTAPTATATVIDPFGSPARLHEPSDQEDRFDANIATTGVAHKLTKYRAAAEHKAPELLAAGNQYDIVYIDGSHKADSVFVNAADGWRLTRRGGLLIFDDYPWGEEFPEHHRPKVAVDAFLASFQGECEEVHIGYQVIVRKLSDVFVMPGADDPNRLGPTG